MEGLTKSADSDGVEPETLAKRLTSGPLPLGYALLCATDVAYSLRTMHEERLIHGSVDARSVIVTDAGAQLLPPNGHARDTASGVDVSAFGALLYEMLTGSKPRRNSLLLPQIISRNAEEGIRIAAMRLASKCMRFRSSSSSGMQGVLTELRLLSLEARIREKPASVPPVTAIPERTRTTVLTEKPNPQADAPPEGPVVYPIFAAVPAVEFIETKDVDSMDPPPSGVKCPVCSVPELYPSRPRNWIESLLSVCGSPPFRCHRCFHRYVMIGGCFWLAKASRLKPNRKPQTL